MATCVWLWDQENLRQAEALTLICALGVALARRLHPGACQAQGQATQSQGEFGLYLTINGVAVEWWERWARNEFDEVMSN